MGPEQGNAVSETEVPERGSGSARKLDVVYRNEFLIGTAVLHLDGVVRRFRWKPVAGSEAESKDLLDWTVTACS